MLASPPATEHKRDQTNRDDGRQFEASRLVGLEQLPRGQPNHCQNERHEDSEIKKPESEERHFEFAVGLGPAGMKFDHAAGVEMISSQKDKECRGNQRAERERESMSANLRVAGDEKTRQHDAQRHERVNVEERYRSIKRELNPKRERSGTMSILRAEIFYAPMPKQDHAG